MGSISGALCNCAIGFQVLHEIILCSESSASALSYLYASCEKCADPNTSFSMRTALGSRLLLRLASLARTLDGQHACPSSHCSIVNGPLLCSQILRAGTQGQSVGTVSLYPVSGDTPMS